MSTSTVRQQSPEKPAAVTYWRRRFITLTLGLSVLALVAWAFSGSLGGSAPAAPAAATKSLSPPSPGPSSPAAKAGHSPVARASHSPVTDDRRPTRKRPQASTGPVTCPAGAVVLSLFSSQPSYSTSQTPQFAIDVVSTASQACMFDIGSRHVVLRILSGTLPVWSSGQCAEGDASLVTELHRGVPTVVSIGWDGEHSTPGCPVPGAAAASGNYTAVAADGSLRSNTLSFRIG
jgi:hypothetical protein